MAADIAGIQELTRSVHVGALADDGGSTPAYVDKEMKFNALALEIWIRSIDANQDTALYQMEKTTKAQDAARKWRDLKNQLDTVIADLSNSTEKGDSTRPISDELRAELVREDVMINGRSARNEIANKTQFSLGELRAMSVSIDTHISGYTDMSPKNQIETQKAITNVQTVVQGATGQISQNARQLQEIVSNTYR
ncbi:hypothetical protein CURE108131_04540 [Cupriavidus respiraculi]|uniref:Flagellin n=1 Tax=Cupriavidus respiraculi TaxID=195930 RepID=A0ABM8WJH3_9BURK|nr:hypothetical protein [Cupriavidus respiraculi]MBY4948208.1 hypothetical protein [Cupriavidus respiraculi]CAG9167563.1 hypothetical protein LMG21510_00780 [Cupriavidus respiraculi]